MNRLVALFNTHTHERSHHMHISIFRDRTKEISLRLCLFLDYVQCVSFFLSVESHTPNPKRYRRINKALRIAPKKQQQQKQPEISVLECIKSVLRIDFNAIIVFFMCFHRRICFDPIFHPKIHPSVGKVYLDQKTNWKPNSRNSDQITEIMLLDERNGRKRYENKKTSPFKTYDTNHFDKNIHRNQWVLNIMLLFCY